MNGRHRVTTSMCIDLKNGAVSMPAHFSSNFSSTLQSPRLYCAGRPRVSILERLRSAICYHDGVDMQLAGTAAAEAGIAPREGLERRNRAKFQPK
jgi:hypothetical protein